MLKKTMPVLRIALAQINPAVGDIRGNVEKIIFFIEKAKSFAVDIVAFPELSVLGSPPNDLLFCEGFVKQTEKETKRILSHTKNITAIIGSIHREGSSLFNSALIMSQKKIVALHSKRGVNKLPHFNERRYFNPGTKPCIMEMDGASIGVIIGDEIEDCSLEDRMSLYIVMDSSFYRVGEVEKKREKLKQRFFNGTFGYVNLVGGQDDWIFYGGSFLFRKGRVISQGPLFDEYLLVSDVNVDKASSHPEAVVLKKANLTYTTLPAQSEKKGYSLEEELLSALILSTKDYVKKNGFKRVFIGLSGGIDSALVAYIASRAVGSENVTCLFMPTRFTSKESYEDAHSVANNLGIELIKIPIDGIFESYIELFREFIGEEVREITMENIQPRIRANILMAFSNNFEGLVLTTGNKSEIATGYCTLYGDTAGGFSVLKDIPKTFVYKLAEYINKKEGLSVIPKRVLQKPPSAELKYDQKDSDTLPPYEVLDEILKDYIEKKIKQGRRIKRRYDPKMLEETLNRFFKNEYKRRQSPIGPILFPKSLGREMNLPVTNLWRYKSWNL